MNGVNPGLATMENITDYRQNETKNYRLPIGKIQLIDCRHGLTLSILVLRKKSILYFVSSDGLTEQFPLSLLQVHCFDQYQNHRSHTLMMLLTLQILSKKKGKKIKRFLFRSEKCLD